MKIIYRKSSFYLLSLLLVTQLNVLVFAQNSTEKVSKIPTSVNYTEEPVIANDPLKAHIYKLKNGLTIYLSVYKDAPRIQTYIAVRAGSKNDPANATGLAHYLEHILFKGTSKFGTIDWVKEKPILEKIENLYEVYRKTTDIQKRKEIYHQIDSISGEAAKYAIANEYDKMLGGIGAQGTNAYTFVEQTVYVNDIPANQLEKWAQIEANRMSEVVPRLFHTELEAVYEEKNKGLDTDSRKVWEALLAGLFQKHTYGTQTTIGTVEHLKNPSIKEIKKYFETYYVPNNMAICLSGDLDPKETIEIIDKYFGSWKSKSIPSFTPTVEDSITSPIVKQVKGPNAESVALAFRFPGINSDEAKKLEMVSRILSNSQAGLIDLNLNQAQKVLGAYAYSLKFHDYSALVLGAQPREGQKLEEVKNLLLSQLEEIKNGNFDTWLLDAIINDYKISQLKEYESNKNRADAFVSAFINHTPWKDYVSELVQLSAIKKEDIINFAKTYFTDKNYVVVFKNQGVDSAIVKVEKPKITPVSVNREANSPFYKLIMEQEVIIVSPVFLDYQKDITTFNLSNGSKVNYLKNVENEIFNIYFLFDVGSNSKLSLATQYLSYLGSNTFNAIELKKEFFKLGCNYDVIAGEDKIYVSLTGLNSNFDKALILLENLLRNPKADDEALQALIADILKSRANSKLAKQVILNRALMNYGKYGSQSPFTNIIPEAELKNIKSEELITLLKDLFNFEHKVLYYGPASNVSLTNSLNKIHSTTTALKPIQNKKIFSEIPFAENEVLWVNYDMVQAEVILLSKSFDFDPTKVPLIDLYNEYFGGSMSSIVFQEMRESKALAYSVKSSYSLAKEKNKPNYVVSYIGTQADKLEEALAGMQTLLNNMPEAALTFQNSKDAIVNTIETERITKSSILFDYEQAHKLGLQFDIRKSVYEGVRKYTFADIKNFQNQFVSNQKQKILVIGSKDKLNFKVLEKYGKVRELKLEEVFGY